MVLQQYLGPLITGVPTSPLTTCSLVYLQLQLSTSGHTFKPTPLKVSYVCSWQRWRFVLKRLGYSKERRKLEVDFKLHACTISCSWTDKSTHRNRYHSHIRTTEETFEKGEILHQPMTSHTGMCTDTHIRCMLWRSHIVQQRPLQRDSDLGSHIYRLQHYPEQWSLTSTPYTWLGKPTPPWLHTIIPLGGD